MKVASRVGSTLRLLLLSTLPVVRTLAAPDRAPALVARASLVSGALLSSKWSLSLAFLVVIKHIQKAQRARGVSAENTNNITADEVDASEEA